MKRHFWDKLRRDRNVWKPSYREAFWEERALQEIKEKLRTRLRQKFSFAQPFSASQLNKRLRASGLAGRKLKDTVRAVLKGEKKLAWVECELRMRALFDEGFVPVAFEETPNRRIIRFERQGSSTSQTASEVFTFSRIGSPNSGTRNTA